jgi:hypothetical protein
MACQFGVICGFEFLEAFIKGSYGAPWAVFERVGTRVISKDRDTVLD